MHAYYRTYRWKEGRPLGVEKVNPSEENVSYRLVADPYYKWLSIEKYEGNSFKEIIYDSRLLDFRKLKPQEQIAWQKVFIDENEKRSLAWIRNQDDRVILKEECFFEAGLCVRCVVYSLEGGLLSIHRLLYKEKGDLFNGMILFDRENRPVFYRIYSHYQEGQFIGLEKEEWEILNLPLDIKTDVEGLAAQK